MSEQTRGRRRCRRGTRTPGHADMMRRCWPICPDKPGARTQVDTGVDNKIGAGIPFDTGHTPMAFVEGRKRRRRANSAKARCGTPRAVAASAAAAQSQRRSAGPNDAALTRIVRGRAERAFKQVQHPLKLTAGLAERRQMTGLFACPRFMAHVWAGRTTVGASNRPKYAAVDYSVRCPGEFA